MAKFQVGDFVRWDNRIIIGRKNLITCKVLRLGTSNTNIYRLQPLERQPNLMSEFWAKEEEVYPASGYCLVCQKNVGLEGNKLKPHNKGCDLCYGSYMPGL
jgi:hypothetical protein